ncbi:uncharacterized protein [Misgurnus anguillicaudatus]|uniref:uncharacterized protein isoform X2 n=1 Tax=Misgurnus anguillicaudatus TaxID=75329 RepID=UPI003CCF62EF
MSSYWAKRRRILKGVERDKQEIAAANDALLAVILAFDRVNPPVNENQHAVATTSHGQTVTPEENQENVEPSESFRAGVSPIIQSPLHRAKSSSTTRQVLSFTPPAANLPYQYMGENVGGESHRSVIGPCTPLASRVQHEVFSFEDFQRLQNENQALRGDNQALRGDNQALRGDNQALRKENQALRGDNQALRGDNQALRKENQALRKENQALRKRNARAASDDSGSLQEQVKQLWATLKMFACTGESGTTCKQHLWLLV